MRQASNPKQSSIKYSLDELGNWHDRAGRFARHRDVKAYQKVIPKAKRKVIDKLERKKKTALGYRPNTHNKITIKYLVCVRLHESNPKTSSMPGCTHYENDLAAQGLIWFEEEQRRIFYLEEPATPNELKQLINKKGGILETLEESIEDINLGRSYPVIHFLRVLNIRKDFVFNVSEERRITRRGIIIDLR